MPLVAQTPAAACALADDLARLIDDMTMRGVPWDRLDGLVPDALDPYWQLTLKFLQIAREAWPADAARARLDRAGGAARCVDQGGGRAAGAQDRRAGDRGGFDRLDPGDRGTDRDHRAAAAWRGGAAGPRHRSRRGILAADRRRCARNDIAPAPGHPQFAMQALLARIGIARDAVERLAEASGRERLVSEVLRPAAATDLWRQPRRRSGVRGARRCGARERSP